MSGFFQKFTLYELVVMAVMAALDIATKQIVAPIAHIVCGPFAIPSGALAGGFYMMWIVIGYGIVRKPGAALIISTIQALLVFFTGVVGSHGIMSLFTYICPGMAGSGAGAYHYTSQMLLRRMLRTGWHRSEHDRGSMCEYRLFPCTGGISDTGKERRNAGIFHKRWDRAHESGVLR